MKLDHFLITRACNFCGKNALAARMGMGIELPTVAEVDAAVLHWRANDPRFGALLERYGDTPRALRHFGLILWDQGQPDAAVRIFTGAVALDPTDARLWCDLSGALNAAGQLNEASVCMEQSLLRDHLQADGWLRLGTIRNVLGDTNGAEIALKTALVLDPQSNDAKLSLGLLSFGAKRFEAATLHLREALDANEVPNAAVEAVYAQALSHLGDYAGSAAAFRVSLALEPANETVILKFAQAQYMADLITGTSLEDAAAACRAIPAVTDQAFEKIERQAFHFLSAFGHAEAALRLGEARLAEAPDDPERTYLLAVLKGDALDRAPDAYVVAHFDKFAGQFDKQLVGVLGYKAFGQLVGLVDAQPSVLGRILDLGCGTGLAGSLLAKPGRHLTGVDLSGGMLEKARERGCYDVLVSAEAISYLADKDKAFDLIFAADVLIYIGDLTLLMERAVKALAPGGLFAFTIETNIGADVALMASGRFAHALDYVVALCTEVGLKTIVTQPVELRYETKGFVAGDLILMRLG